MDNPVIDADNATHGTPMVIDARQVNESIEMDEEESMDANESTEMDEEELAFGNESTEMEEEELLDADEYKRLGNEALKEGSLNRAVEMYSKAIAMHKRSPIYFASRALAHLKLENFGSALNDASEAVAIDPMYLKGYYRRGSALKALGKLEEAKADFVLALELEPTNGDLFAKLTQIENEITIKRFLGEANSGEDPFLNPNFDPNKIEVEESYTGPRLEGETTVTLEFMDELLQHFKDEKSLHMKYVLQILHSAQAILKAEDTLVEVAVPQNSHLTICGDVHGQFYDLLNIYESNGKPSDDNPYLFNGDFVDRGSFSLEIILTLLGYKVLYPRGMHLNRGNHEALIMNKMYGFEGEVQHKCGNGVMALFTDLFQWLPLAHVVGTKVLVVHGGLFSEDGVTLDDIRQVSRHREPPEQGIMNEILWSDPQPELGRSPSQRGTGVRFGPDVAKSFLQSNGLELLIRSHEVKDEGFEVIHDGHTVTVFSAPNYCDIMGNRGAFIRLDGNLTPTFTQFEAVPHPWVVPMQYAGSWGIS